jgi:hypothetical protein
MVLKLCACTSIKSLAQTSFLYGCCNPRFHWINLICMLKEIHFDITNENFKTCKVEKNAKFEVLRNNYHKEGSCMMSWTRVNA